MNNSFKIFHLISSLSRGGRERQLCTIVSNSNPVALHSTIIFLNHKDSTYINEYNLKDRVRQIKKKGKIARLLTLHQLLKREVPDVVYTWGNGESVSILLLKPFHRFIFINGSLRHGIRVSRFTHYLRTLVLHLCRHVVANSKAGLRANNLRKGYVLYNGIDKKFLEPLPGRRSRREQLCGADENITVFISVANLVPYKDYFTVLRALKRMKDQNISFRYLILGEGPMRKKISTAISDYGLNDHVQLMGNVENVDEFLKVSDIFIHSSRGEGISNAILEAMYAGLPVIATNVGGVPETVFPGSSMLFPYKDHEALYQCLLKAPELISSFNPGSEEYREHLKKFSVEIMMERYEEIVSLVMKKQ